VLCGVSITTSLQMFWLKIHISHASISRRCVFYFSLHLSIAGINVAITMHKLTFVFAFAGVKYFFFALPEICLQNVDINDGYTSNAQACRVLVAAAAAAFVVFDSSHRYIAVLLQYMYEFLEAVIMRQTAQEEAYRKLDEMAAKLTETLRKSAKMVCNTSD